MNGRVPFLEHVTSDATVKYFVRVSPFVRKCDSAAAHFEHVAASVLPSQKGTTVQFPVTVAGRNPFAS
jgi:hypothetical protein